MGASYAFVCQLDYAQCYFRIPERFEPKHRITSLRRLPVILLNHVIQVLVGLRMNPFAYIMIVEADDAVRDLIHKTVRAPNNTVGLARDEDEAVAKALQRRPTAHHRQTTLTTPC